MGRVRCRADHTYPGRPTGFDLNSQDHQVQKLLKEWHSPGGKGYLVQTEEGAVYQLFWRSAAHLWEIRAVDVLKER